MIPALMSAAGAGLLVLAWWWRRPPRRGSRWWQPRGTDMSVALVGAPGVGLALAMAWPMSLVTAGYRAAAVAVIPFCLGLVAALWTGLFLPTPQWVRPRWARGVRRGRRGR